MPPGLFSPGLSLRPRRARALRATAAGSAGRLALPLAVAFMAAGCAGTVGALSGFGAGERVAYHVWNDTGLPVIERPELHAPESGERLYANLRAQAPGLNWAPGPTAAVGADPAGLSPVVLSAPTAPAPGWDDELLTLPRPMEGAFAAARAGHRVPARVRVSWRRPPLAGEPLYGGRLEGPVELDLRAAIPPSVLEQAAAGWRYRLDIAIGANAEAPSVRWRLMREGDDGIFEIRRSQGW